MLLLYSPTSVESNPEFDYMKEFTDNDFKYSAAQFDMDYLENITSETNSDLSDLARQSLFVKFDPLVGRQSPRVNVAPANKSHLVPKSDG